jgi:putative peptidoglycan lipid II flippase
MLDRKEGLARSTVIVYLASLAAQAVGVVTQIVVAKLFGARAEMDAFLAACTLPQYLITVLTASLGAVFIPVFVEYTRKGQTEEAWRIARGLLNQCVAFLACLVIFGLLFARPLLKWTTPGLTGATMDLAVRVALVTWPCILATGVMSLLVGLYQAQEYFTRSVMVPLLGSVVNLALIPILATKWGVAGLAAAGTLSVFFQVFMLLPILRRSQFSFTFAWDHPGIRSVWHLLWPLLLSNVLIRWTPVVERYLASGLPEGSIAHLGYAFKLLTYLTVFVSAGIGTTFFPRLASSAANADPGELRHTLALGLRLIWLMVAPVIAVGIVLSLPLVSALLQRGRFLPADAQSVAHLLVLYLPALAAMSLGSVTGRAFYAIKATRFIAGMGVIEAILYVAYTVLLARSWAASGIVLGYVLYFSLSLLWQLPFLWLRTGRTGGRTTIISFSKTALAALAAGMAAWAAARGSAHPWTQLALGSSAGLTAYAATLLAVRSSELRLLAGKMRNMTRGTTGGASPDTWPYDAAEVAHKTVETETR